jgi:hypothetical protein
MGAWVLILFIATGDVSFKETGPQMTPATLQVSPIYFQSEVACRRAAVQLARPAKDQGTGQLVVQANCFSTRTGAESTVAADKRWPVDRR